MPATLNLRFDRGVIDPRITFVRNSIATRVNKQGLIETVPAGVPRIDYDPVTGACKGLLVEEARANLYSRSEDFDNVAWTKGNLTVTANSTTAPDGTSFADKLVSNTTPSAYHYITQSIPKAASPITYTTSIFVKAAEQTTFTLLLLDSPAVGLAGARFNTDGTVIGTPWVLGGFTAVSYAVQVLGNGWCRFSITATSNSDTSIRMQLTTESGGTATYTGDGTSGVYIWGAQLEAGSTASSYIPTTTTSLSRTSETATINGQNFLNFYNQSEGTFVVTGDGATGGYLLMPTAVSTGNRLQLSVGGNSAFEFYSLAGGVATNSCQGATVPSVANTFATIAGAYKSGSFNAAINGTLPFGADKTGGVPTDLTELRIGYGFRAINGHIARITYYNERLPNWMLQALSAAPTQTVMPSLQLPFAKTKRLDPRINFTRNSIGTYFDATGVMRTAQAGEARFNHDPVTLKCKGLLVEEQRANLVLYSSDPNTGWSNSGSPTITALTASGIFTPCRVASGGANWHRRQAGSTLTANLPYAFSAIFKFGQGGNVYFECYGDGTHRFGVYGTVSGLSLSAGMTGFTSISTPELKNLGNGLYQLSVVATPIVTLACSAGVGPYSATVGDYIDLYGLQVELLPAASSLASSFIPTTTAAVTRAADTAYINGTNFSSFYRQDEGTFVATADYQSFPAYGRVFQADGGADSTAHVVLNTTAGDSRIYAATVIGGVTQIDTSSSGNNGTLNTQFNCAYAYKTNDSAFQFGSNVVVADTACSMPAVSILRIGSGNGSGFLNGHIASLSFFPSRLSNDKLKALSL